MRVLLDNGITPERSDRIFHFLRDYLAVRNIQADLVRELRTNPVDTSPYRALFSNTFVPDEIRAKLPTWASVRWSRPKSLQFLADHGLPVMPWDRAKTADDVRQLFDRWQTDVVLLKRSFSFGGRGVTAFRRAHVQQLEWNQEHDIFCPELNPADGTTIKAEIFNGQVMIVWQSQAPSPTEFLKQESSLTNIRGAYGERSLLDLPENLNRLLCELSAKLTDLHVGYCSVDFMNARDGGLRTIEINLGFIAAWWTVEFDFFRERYGAALLSLFRERVT